MHILRDILPLLDFWDIGVYLFSDSLVRVFGDCLGYIAHRGRSYSQSTRIAWSRLRFYFYYRIFGLDIIHLTS